MSFWEAGSVFGMNLVGRNGSYESGYRHHTEMETDGLRSNRLIWKHGWFKDHGQLADFAMYELDNVVQ